MPRAMGGWWEEEAHSEFLGLLLNAPDYWAAVWRKRHVAGLWVSERLYGAPGGCSEEGPHSQVIRCRAESQDLGGFLVEEPHRDTLRGGAKVPGLRADSLRRGSLRRFICEG